MTVSVSSYSVTDPSAFIYYRPITLHYRIRESTNPYGNEIRTFDAKFRNGIEVTEDELK